MNCTECEDLLVDFVEGTSDHEATLLVEDHLKQCPECRAKLEDLRRLTGSLIESLRGTYKTFLEGRVMGRIIKEQAAELRRLKMRRRNQLVSAAAAVVAVAACLLVFVLAGPMQDRRAVAAEVLAKAATQASGIKTLHLKCRMRTLPADNFSLIGPTYDFVELDVWKQFGDPVKYRIEKPGRVLVCDGKSTVMLVKHIIHAVKGPPGANFDAGWLRDLADPEKVLSDQLREALANKADMAVKHEDVDGQPKLTVTVEVKAADVGEYMRSKFLMTADLRRVFRFDAKTKRLETMKIILHAKEQDVLVFEVTAADYDPQLAAAVFTLDLPKDVAWYAEPTVLPDNEKYASLKPKQVAEVFFAACAKDDWNEAQKFWGFKLDDRDKKFLGGLKVVNLAEPFQCKPYPGWFVPYEINLKSGDTIKHNLAIRNDNAARRWMVDGGL